MEIVGSVIDSFICFVVVFIAVTTSIALVHAHSMHAMGEGERLYDRKCEREQVLGRNVKRERVREREMYAHRWLRVERLIRGTSISNSIKRAVRVSE